VDRVCVQVPASRVGDGNADRYGDPWHLVSRFLGREGKGDRSAESFGNFGCVIERAVREHERELLAAHPADEVIGAQQRRRGRGDGRQDGVSGRVPVGVVDLLEVVDVDDAQRDRGAGADGSGDLAGCLAAPARSAQRAPAA
jgi:hypothetical protein